MTWQKPSPRVVWIAIHAYLSVAYPDSAGADHPAPGTPADGAALDGAASSGPQRTSTQSAASASIPVSTPSAVRARLETLRSTPDDAFYDCPVFERAGEGGKDPGQARDPRAATIRYALRLGNRFYPHMKLVIDRSPDGQIYLLRADTHDSHVQPKPGSREYSAFQELSRQNHAISDAVESAWEAAGLPTFKKFLRDDLQRRRTGG